MLYLLMVLWGYGSSCASSFAIIIGDYTLDGFHARQKLQKESSFDQCECVLSSRRRLVAPCVVLRLVCFYEAWLSVFVCVRYQHGTK